MLHNLSFFFSSKCHLFHNATLFGSCIIHILNTECAKLKGNSGANGLNETCSDSVGTSEADKLDVARAEGNDKCTEMKPKTRYVQCR